MGMWEASRLAALPRRLGALGALSLILVACGQGVGPVGAASPTSAATAARPSLYQADTVFDRMTDEQRVGQLFMVGLSSEGADPVTLADAIIHHHAGSVVLYGPGWSSAALVRATASSLQAMATPAAPPRVPLCLA